MKTIYRNCQIESYTDNCLGGWREVYWSAFTSDGYELTSGFGGGTKQEMLKEMKDIVDEFLDKYKGNVENWENRD